VAKIELFQGFFSYTHLDAELDPDLVEALTTRLEMRVTRKLTNASFSIWRDVDKIRTGQQWDERIGAAVRASQVFIVLMTPKWFERDYCRKEYRIFQEVEQGIAVGEHVVPLLAHAIKPQDFDQEQKATFDDLNRRQYKKTIATTFRKMTADQREIIVDEIADDIEGMIERLRGKSTSLQPRATAQQAATEQKDKAARALADEQRKPQLDVAFNPDIPGCRRYFEDAQTTHFRMKIRNSSEQTACGLGQRQGRRGRSRLVAMMAPAPVSSDRASMLEIPVRPARSSTAWRCWRSPATRRPTHTAPSPA
jgi:hypothetical protein